MCTKISGEIHRQRSQAYLRTQTQAHARTCTLADADKHAGGQASTQARRHAGTRAMCVAINDKHNTLYTYTSISAHMCMYAIRHLSTYSHLYVYTRRLISACTDAIATVAFLRVASRRSSNRPPPFTM